jgi:hypothetical protein
MATISTRNLRGLSLFLGEQTIERQQGLHDRFAGKSADSYRRVPGTTLSYSRTVMADHETE